MFGRHCNTSTALLNLEGVWIGLVFMFICFMFMYVI